MLAPPFLTSPSSLLHPSYPSLQTIPHLFPRFYPSTNQILVPTHFQLHDRTFSFSSLHRLEPNDASARGSVVLTKCALDAVGVWSFEALCPSTLSSDIDERLSPLLMSASSLRGPSASAVLRSLAHLVLQFSTPRIGRQKRPSPLLPCSVLIWSTDISDC